MNLSNFLLASLWAGMGGVGMGMSKGYWSGFLLFSMMMFMLILVDSLIARMQTGREP